MIKNIIKRIIVGVSVALILSFIYSKVDALPSDVYINDNVPNGAFCNFYQQPGTSLLGRSNLTYYYNSGNTYLQSNNITVGNLTLAQALCRVYIGIEQDTINNPSTKYVYLSFNVRYYGLPTNSVQAISIYDYVCDLYYTETDNMNVVCPYVPISYINKVQDIYITFNSNASTYNKTTNLTIRNIFGFQSDRDFITSNYSILKSQQQTINEINNGITDVNNSINDDSGVDDNDVSNSANDWSSSNANNGVINQLVLMPITLLNSIVNGLSNSCSPYNLGNLLGTDLILPCVNMSNVLGSVWNIIDIIISGVFIFKFGTYLVKIFNDFTNLKSGQIDQLYGGGN